MLLINCELILILTANYITCEAKRGPNFAITDIKVYAPVAT